MNKKIILIVAAALLVIAAAVFAVLYTSGESVPAQSEADKPETRAGFANDPVTEEWERYQAAMSGDTEAAAQVVDRLIENMNKAVEEGRAMPYENSVHINARVKPEVTYDEAGNPVSVYGLPITDFTIADISLEHPETPQSITVKLADGCDLREALLKLYANGEIITAVPVYTKIIKDWYI